MNPRLYWCKYCHRLLEVPTEGKNYNLSGFGNLSYNITHHQKKHKDHSIEAIFGSEFKKN